MTSEVDAPGHDELEVSLFGPGYGEAMAIHLGKGRWVLVDSCLNPNGSPATLDYLQSFEGATVRAIVATHWHDDHVKGLSRLVRAWPKAKFVMPSALRREEFLKLIVLYRNDRLTTSSGVDEFIEVLGLLQARKRRKARFGSPTLALADRQLVHEKDVLGQGCHVKLYALSPSDAACLQATLAFSRLMPEAESAKKRVASPRPNHTSIALWLEAGDVRVLFGADLEVTRDVETGWEAIVNDSTVTANNRAGVFKIPHHGSETGHSETTWDKLVNDPISLLTPFNRGRKPLPTRNDILRLEERSSAMYITALPQSVKRKRSPSLQKMVSSVVREMREVQCGWGHVRLRIKPSMSGGVWDVSASGDAQQVFSETPHRG